MNELLHIYGWDDMWQSVWEGQQYNDSLIPARVIAHYGQHYKVVSTDIRSAEITGKMLHTLERPDLPKVGDWVAVSPQQTMDIIRDILPRRSELVRKAAGMKMRRQVMAANVDHAFVIQSLDHDLNVRRLKRYLFQLRLAGISATIVLNKRDLRTDWQAVVEDFSKQFTSIKTIAISARDNQGITAITDSITSGMTAVLLGSSGVGKSTLINTLLNEQRQTTQEVRMDDSKGRHTTTHRELFVLPHGGILIDSPGIRELQLWASEDDATALDADISAIGEACKFKNCTHIAEPSCAVLQAVSLGMLDQEDIDAYHKMQQEIAFLNTRSDMKEKFRYEEKQRKLQKQYRSVAQGNREKKG